VVGQIAILSGERGTGKSTVCQRLAGLARSRGRACAGIITLSRHDDVRDVLDVASGAVRRLTIEGDGQPAVLLGRFRFAADTLAWGAQVLEQALPCDLLIVDELGPLEIERGEGWHRALDVLASEGYRLAVVVVRPGLVEQVLDRIPARATTVVVTLENRDHLPTELLERLEDTVRDEPVA
jgi:nucleoside-triphosphatase